jgi:hypothetical protein
VAAATGDAPNTQSAGTSALTALMAYIPTEILTAYVAIPAGLQEEGQQTQAPPGAALLTPPPSPSSGYPMGALRTLVAVLSRAHLEVLASLRVVYEDR